MGGGIRWDRVMRGEENGPEEFTRCLCSLKEPAGGSNTSCEGCSPARRDLNNRPPPPIQSSSLELVRGGQKRFSLEARPLCSAPASRHRLSTPSTASHRCGEVLCGARAREVAPRGAGTCPSHDWAKQRHQTSRTPPQASLSLRRMERGKEVGARGPNADPDAGTERDTSLKLARGRFPPQTSALSLAVLPSRDPRFVSSSTSSFFSFLCSRPPRFTPE